MTSELLRARWLGDGPVAAHSPQYSAHCALAQLSPRGRSRRRLTVMQNIKQEGAKRLYTVPQLTVHGTLEQITQLVGKGAGASDGFAFKATPITNPPIENPPIANLS